MTSAYWRLCALAATALVVSGLVSPAALAGSADPDSHRLTAASREGGGAIQIVFVDGASVRFSASDLAPATREPEGRKEPAFEDGILRLENGRLRHLPVLLSGQSASAHASLAIHAALRGDSRSALAALGRAKADIAGTTGRHGPGWASVTRAHVTLAEAQLLDLDGRHEDAESLYRAGLDAIAGENGGSAPAGVADAQAMLSAELSRNLARNLAVQGRTAEAQRAERSALRGYVARFGEAPAYTGRGLNGGGASGFTQVAVSRVPGGAVVGHLLLSGLLIVVAVGPEAGDDNVKDARGEPGGTTRSPGPLDDDSGVRAPGGAADGTPRSDNGSADTGGSREASGTAGGTAKSSDGAQNGSGTRDASGEAGGTARSAEGSGGSGTRDASGEAGGTSRSADASDSGNTRDASGEAGGTSRSTN